MTTGLAVGFVGPFVIGEVSSVALSLAMLFFLTSLALARGGGGVMLVKIEQIGIARQAGVSFTRVQVQDHTHLATGLTRTGSAVRDDGSAGRFYVGGVLDNTETTYNNSNYHYDEEDEARERREYLNRLRHKHRKKVELRRKDSEERSGDGEGEEADACSICLESVLSKTEGGNQMLGCGHVFHKSCIRAWARSGNGQKGCPVCRFVGL
eukprot:CAMPEP_0182475986 /NCGR_PEP_ID=MMETSP1319-20130603/28285_1 /TAXON_ID=172717 /ORGANISM="Bolidomonas pacifica, Strain RCC208" /LENGTH=208 /DNA_ID=CAMNT_0024677035 /DNA_START=320 /DNA_END=946 /DNA_ORIENTATION=+